VADKLLVSRRDAAAMLSISLRTLDKLVSGKCIAVRKVGARVLVPRRALERFSEGRSAAGNVNKS
jgi:excisionase family DNA binding protein